MERLLFVKKSRSDTTEASIQRLSSLGLSHGRSPFSDIRKLIFRQVRSENSIKGAIRELRRQILDIDAKLMELAESEQEREKKKGKEESKDGDPSLVVSQENEQAEQALMLHEEVLAAEFRSDCATEWNRRRLTR